MSVLHPLARTTPRTRAELKAEDPSLTDSELARRYGVTAPTVRKWRERDSTLDHSHRPHKLHCTLDSAQEAVAMEMRRTLWLPLDDLLAGIACYVHSIYQTERCYLRCSRAKIQYSSGWCGWNAQCSCS